MEVQTGELGEAFIALVASAGTYFFDEENRAKLHARINANGGGHGQE